MKWFSNKISAVAIAALACCFASAESADSIAATPLQWRVGVEFSPAFVPHTNRYLSGENTAGKATDAAFAGSLRGDFSFSPASRKGRLYPGLYQGLGVDARGFSGGMLGSPVSVYVFQGAPVARLGRRLWLGYEWQFGAAFGWKHRSEVTDDAPFGENGAISTAVTAHMGVALKLHYRLNTRWQLSAAIGATHFSNGNTSYPNAGVNTVGLSIGAAYSLTPGPADAPAAPAADAEADAGEWFFDITAYGGWRKRGLALAGDAVMCPGRFGVAGLQLAPMRKFNRWVAAGVSLDMQYDESAGLAPYWVEGTWGDEVRFRRPPFGKQFSAGLSAHAELTMPIFAINAGLGYDFVCPDGGQRFYQSLALKTFVTRNLYLNVGYRLGRFRDPQNLMLGLGVRL